MPQPVRGPGRCGKATVLWHLNPHPSQGSPGCGPLRPPSPAVAPTLVSPASGPEPQGLRLLRGGQRSALSLSCSTGVNVRRSSRPQPCLHADAVCGVSLGPYESCRKDGFDGPDVCARAGPTAGLQRGAGALPALRVGLRGAGRACGPRHAGPRGRGSAPREAGGVDRRGPWARASTARLLRLGLATGTVFRAATFLWGEERGLSPGDPLGRQLGTVCLRPGGLHVEVVNKR